MTVEADSEAGPRLDIAGSARLIREFRAIPLKTISEEGYLFCERAIGLPGKSQALRRGVAEAIATLIFCSMAEATAPTSRDREKLLRRGIAVSKRRGRLGPKQVSELEQIISAIDAFPGLRRGRKPHFGFANFVVALAQSYEDATGRLPTISYAAGAANGERYGGRFLRLVEAAFTIAAEIARLLGVARLNPAGKEARQDLARKALKRRRREAA